MNTMLAQLRLFQLISPALPVGGFTYSQGLERAVEDGWLPDADSCALWWQGVLDDSMATLELPVLLRLMQAAEQQDWPAFNRWAFELLAHRETSELRKEERQRGAAMRMLLPKLDISYADEIADALAQTQLAGIALAAVQWQIPATDCAAGYLWSWLENQVTAAIKLVPLGQSQGQQLLLQLAEKLPACVEQALEVSDDQIGSNTPALALASSRHETQYTRLFRS